MSKNALFVLCDKQVDGWVVDLLILHPAAVSLSEVSLNLWRGVNRPEGFHEGLLALLCDRLRVSRASYPVINASGHWIVIAPRLYVRKWATAAGLLSVR